MSKFRDFKTTRNLRDIFRKYPYIKKHPKNITRPSLKGCTINEDHHLSLNWREWHEIMKIYLKYVGQYVRSGYAVKLPYRMGVLQLHKYKYQKQERVDYNHLRKTGEVKFHNNNHTNGHIPVFKWHRNPEQAHIKNRFHWAARMNRNFKHDLSKMIFDDPSTLLSFSYVPAQWKKVSIKHLL